jgi:hypothetical protein
MVLIPYPMLLLLLLSCASDKSTDSYHPAGGGCDTLWEIEAQPPPGCTPQAGCESVCQDVDSQGLLYADCYIDTENMVFCQYEPPCR